MFLSTQLYRTSGKNVINYINTPVRCEHRQKTNSVQANEIRALRRMKGREIDTIDIPPSLDWGKAVVGRFYKPIKKPLTIRLDTDVLAWFKTRINALLRRGMETAGSEATRRSRR